MGVFDEVDVTPAATNAGVFSSVSSSTPAKTGGVFANVTAAPQKAPTVAPAAPAPYFQGKEPSGSFIGVSDELDPFSNKPFLAYRTPGATSTTTDKTRVASEMNPEVAAPTPKTSFENPRMPESASQAVRANEGATSDEQLDHRMALAVGGSNDLSNLKLIPTKDNQAASKLEGQLPSQIANGATSLFQAQNEEAKAKGLPTPWTDQDIQRANVFDSIKDAPADSTLGTIKNTILGLPNAATTVGKTIGASLANIAVSLYKQYTSPSPEEQSLEDSIGQGPDAFKGPSGAFGSTAKAAPSGLLKAVDIPVMRTIEPMVQPLVNDATAALIFNQPELYKDFTDEVNKGSYAQLYSNNSKLNLQGQTEQAQAGRDILGGILKTPPQVIGDTAQAVLGAYFPEVFGKGMEAFAAKGLGPAILSTATHGAMAGFTFGVAQAASSGSTDPKELGAIVMQNTVAGALLTLATAGVTHGVLKGTGPVVDAIKSRLPKSLAEAQRGFVRIPGLGDLPEEGDVAPQKKQEPEKALTEPVNRPLFRGDNTTETKLNNAGEIDLTTDKSVAQEYAKQYGDKGVVNEHYLSPDAKILDVNDYFKQTGKDSFSEEGITDYADEHGYDAVDFSTLGRKGALRNSEVKVLNPDVLKTKEEAPTKNTARVNTKLEAMAEKSGSFEDFYNRTGVTKESLDVTAQKKGFASARDFYDNVKSGPDRIQAGVPAPSASASLTDLALQQKTPHAFYQALTDSQRQQVLHTIDPDGLGSTAESAAHAFYASAKDNIAPRDQELTSKTPPGGSGTDTNKSRQVQEKPPQPKGAAQTQPNKKGEPGGASQSSDISYDETVTEHNGGVNPPENKGGMQPPEIDWSKGKDIAAIRQSTDTLERTLEKVFPKKEADILNEYLTTADRRNEAARVEYVTDVRKEAQKYVVKELGIKPATVKSAWVQRLGEGRVTLAELQRDMPNDWQNIQKASDYFRKQYDTLIDKWNGERSKAGLKPINKRPNYFRHFIDLTSFANMYGLDFRESALPTAISGMTEYFRSQSPWTNAAMRRLGSTATDDAVGGFDNYLDSASRAIFHTDTVQRGRLVDKYLRQSADANAHAAQDIRDAGEDKETPPPIQLPRLANTLKQWTDKVSGKQNIVDRVIESIVGRNSIAVMRALTRQFGLNVIGGNLSSAVTHAIPSVYTLATVDKGAAFHGLYGTLTSPFLEDFRKIDGVSSDFLTRRFGKEEIQPTLGEKAAAVISAPFHMVDQFMSRFAVEAKYHEGVAKGLDPKTAMQQADNYASRVVGDRSSGNLPPIMSSKLLGPLTQFQIEVNDNLRVLLHDIPRWENGSVPKIASKFVQFALYSYLFNQTMQYIKGSGKGLDPIDMGLTLMGLNDEGHDQTLMQRFSSVGSDFLGELPFTSVLTGGQIPAFQPLSQAVSDAASGAPLKALEGVVASFASPVGGGQQVQKSLTAIQAWKQGYVTNSAGKVIATVPHTVPTLVQGVLFGKSAFDSVKKSNTEIGNLDATIKEGQAASKLKDTQAANMWQQLKAMPADQAKTQLQQIAASDPDMAKRVIASAKADAAGITKQDTLLKTLGVTNGARAQYIANQLSSMSTDAAKKAYLADLATKKILTSAVLAQLATLLKK